MRLLLIIAMLFLSACSILPSQDEGGVQHVVMVWFNDEVSQQDIDEVIAQSYALQHEIPLIRAIHVGRAISSERKAVDDSFDLGIVMRFASEQDMQAYVTHPVHKDFVSRYVKGKVARLQIYDF